MVDSVLAENQADLPMVDLVLAENQTDLALADLVEAEIVMKVLEWGNSDESVLAGLASNKLHQNSCHFVTVTCLA
jgi:hypothetical protein